MKTSTFLRSALISTVSSDLQPGVRLIDVAPCLVGAAWMKKQQRLATPMDGALPPAASPLPGAQQDFLMKISKETLTWSGATHVCLPPPGALSFKGMDPLQGCGTGVHVASTTPTAHSGVVLVDYPLSEIGSDYFYGCRAIADAQRQRDDFMHDALHCSPTEMEVTAWLRSSLGCRYEGPHIQSLKVAEEVCRLLSLGCHQVILEEGIAGSTPRWLEVVLKTIFAVGGSASQLGLSMSNSSSLSQSVVHCALAHGLTTFVGSSVIPTAGNIDFPNTIPVLSPILDEHSTHVPKVSGASMAEPRIGMAALLEAALGYQEQVSGTPLTDTEVETLQQSVEFCNAMSTHVAKLAL
ncbi:Hypothetical protein, putative [Bodo saltans]|uniref:Uncharacterized protein n=1 Tax=Bodo saltans TaxID=75058 RepID=A0A0S4J3G8_BODSA|nr:Hypothetical protein, putative [Bodo saltans]|eukprot:CUG85920.1 Hypothetical protein, putative [Bodo saltans]